MAGKIVSVDLSALEYRLITHASHEPILVDIFQNDRDIHADMHQFLYGRLPNGEKERKDGGKTPNYVAVYGAGFKKFWSKIDIEDEAEARKLYNKAITRYPAVKLWKQQVEDFLFTHGYVQNLFDRIRIFGPSELRKKFDVVREAVNWVIQSSGHDILKVFLLRLIARFVDVSPAILLVNEAHDEGVFDVPGRYVKSVVSIMKDESNHLNELVREELGVQIIVPLKADVTVGDTWS